MKDIVKRSVTEPQAVTVELVKLYAEHKTDAAVAVALEVSVGTVKRLKTLLKPAITPAMGGRTMGKKRPLRTPVAPPPPPPSSAPSAPRAQ